MSYLIFARKYRPQTFEDMIGQKPVVQTLQNAIRTNRVTQAYLFSGMRGVGKTTAARILAKALNCVQGPTPTPCNVCESCVSINEDRLIDVLEIDGASNRGIDDIKALRDSFRYKPIHSRYKIIIIDEVHQLSRDAFNALLKTLEEPPPGTVFIFATTEFHKVPATIVSRCQHFEFKKISHKEIINHLMDIAKRENITISPYSLSLIAEAAEGSLRDAQSLLDQAVAFSGDVIGDDDLKEILGSISRDTLYAASGAILDEKPEVIFSLVDGLVEGGYDLRAFYKEMIEHFRNLLLARTLEKPQDILFMSGEEWERLKAEAGKASCDDFLRYLQALQQGESGLRFSSQPRIYLETLLVKLCHFKKLVPIEDLIRRLEGRATEERIPEAGGGSRPSARPAASPPPAPASRPPTKPESARPVPHDEPSAVTPPAPDPNDEFEAILEKLRREKAALAAIIAERSSVRVKEDVLEIIFTADKKFYIETIRRDSKLVERIASEVLGRKIVLQLKGEVGDVPSGTASKEKETEAALKDPTVRYFMNTFKAQVLSVDPVKKPQERS
ncbi:MAG: DNA polymerase III subunit gamma/tau [Candidatus Aminicenantales bacterium]